MLVPLLLIVCIFVRMTAAAADPHPLPDPPSNQNPGTKEHTHPYKHGPIEVLSEMLIRDRQSEHALASVADNTHQMKEQLNAVFIGSTDALMLDRQTGAVSNIRQAAMDLLKNESPEGQALWKAAHEEFARARIEQALTAHDFLEIERQFPLTLAGLKAGLTAVTLLHLSGLSEHALARLEILESNTKGTILESDFFALSEPIRNALLRAVAAESEAASAPTRGTSLKPTEVSVKSIASVPAIAPAWPKPQWSWKELIEDFPNAPQPATTHVLLPFLRSQEFNMGDFSNWRPVLTKGTLIHRTPLRIVALDTSTGKELWTLKTDTVQSSPTSAARGRLNVPMTAEDKNLQLEGLFAIRDLQGYGLMSSDEDHLYFLDSISLINVNYQTNGGLKGDFMGRVTTRQDIGLPSRLVALSLKESTSPQIAWIAGGTSEVGSENNKPFEYRVLASLDASNSSDEPRSSVKPANLSAPQHSLNFPQSADLAPSGLSLPSSGRVATLLQHSFLSPPTGFADQLFVMTEHNHQTYVSSLTKSTGELLWQRPLAHIGRRETSDGRHPSQGCCLLCQGVLVCILHDGIAFGVRPADGQLLWATAFIEAESSAQAGHDFRRLMPTPRFPTSCSVLPVANSSLVVAMHPDSSYVVGMEPDTGLIRWRVARTAIGSASVDGQLDHYIAGITDSKVVMIGATHCRALDVVTGDQLWITETSTACGRAEVSRDRCLIPQEHGPLITVELATGSLTRPRERFLPEQAEQLWGAIASSETHVFAVTPVSISSYARCDAALSDEPLLKSIDEKSTVLTRARLLLLNHQEEQAIELLRDAVAKYSSHVDAVNSTSDSAEAHRQKAIIDRTLAEVILQLWADLYVQAVSESRCVDGSDHDTDPESISARQDVPGAPETRQRLEAYGASENAMLLGELELDSDQQLRAAVLALLSRPDFELQSEDVAELESFAEWSQSLPLTDDWSVRPDLLLSRFITSPTPIPESIEKTGLTACRDVALRAILFPKLLSDEDHAEKLVGRLIHFQEFAMAEAVLLVWQRSCTTDRAGNLLNSLRTHGTLEARSKNSTSGFTATAVSGRKIQFDVSDSLEWVSTAVLLDRSRATRISNPSLLPRSLPYELFLEGTLDQKTHLNFSAKSDGAIVSSLPLPVRPNDYYQMFSPSLYRDAQPSLLPLLGIDTMMMVSCLHPGHPSVLWSGSIRNANDPFFGQISEYIEFGPLGAEFMVWHADGVLHCTHPLTGKDLWSRRMRMKGGEVYGRGLRRIFGDEQVIVVLNEDYTRFERYRTRDGQLLGIGVLNPGPDCDAVTIGRFVVYCDPEGRFCLFDGMTGRNEFADRDPVFRLDNVVPQTFFTLSGNRVLSVTRENELLIIDVLSRRVESRIPVQQHLMGDEVFAYTAFEQNGRLYVGLEDELDVRQPHPNDGSDDLPQIRFGILFSVDPRSGTLLWNQRLQNKKFLVPSGDPTDVLIAIQDRSFQNYLEEIQSSLIHVMLIDGISGEPIAEESISSRLPFRVSHDANDSVIELEAKQTRTRISVSEE